MPTANMVTNGDFEDGLTGWSTIDDGDGTIEVYTADSHSGTQCIKITSPSSSANLYMWQAPCTIGVSYTYSYWAKAIDTGAACYSSQPFNGTIDPIADEWTFYSFTGTAVGVNFLISRYVNTGLAFLIDDVRVTPNEPVKIAIKRVELPDAVASPVDVTETDFGTVKGAMVIAGYASVQGNPSSAAASCSIGFWDGTTMLCSAGGTDNQLATSECNRSQINTRIAQIHFGTAMVATYTISAITDGVRLTMVTDGTAVNRYATVILFGGEDVEAKVGDIVAPDTGDPRADETLTFKPDLVLWHTAGLNSWAYSAGTAAHIMTIGATVSQNGILNRSLCWFDYDNQATTENGTLISQTACASQYYADSVTWQAKCLYLANDKICLDDNVVGIGSDDDIVGYLALKLGGYNVSLQDISTPTTAGTQAFTGLGFKPSHVLVFLGPNTVYDSHAGGLNVSLGASDGTTESCISEHAQDAVGTTNVGAISREKLIDLRRMSTSGELITATLDSFDEDGFTLDYSITHSVAYKGFALAFQTEGNPRLISTAANKLWMVNHGV